MLAEQIPWRQAAPKDLGVRGSWWEIFNDPLLNWLEMRASTGTLAVPVAVARVEQARAIAGIGVCGQASEGELPFLDAMVRAERSQRSDQSDSVQVVRSTTSRFGAAHTNSSWRFGRRSAGLRKAQPRQRTKA